jgi:hypothetical protein
MRTDGLLRSLFTIGASAGILALILLFLHDRSTREYQAMGRGAMAEITLIRTDQGTVRRAVDSLGVVVTLVNAKVDSLAAERMDSSPAGHHNGARSRGNAWTH